MQFDYSDEFPTSWPSRLLALKESGVTEIKSHVAWGAHESLRGARDFSRSSRLRLERYLSLAHQQGLKIELALGFRPSSDAFPAWTYGLKKKSLIPKALWDGDSSRFTLTEVPALDDPEFSEGFLDFLKEVFTLVSLYRDPEGPVVKLSLELDLFDACLNVMDGKPYAEALAARYSTIGQLNQFYQATFSDFSGPVTRQGMRLLFDKRPWLAAYDYKWCLRQVFSSLITEIYALAEEKLVLDLLPSRATTPAPLLVGAWELAMDSTLIGDCSLGVFPLVPGGYATAATVASFRFYEYLSRRAENAGIPFLRLASDRKVTFTARDVIVISGKYAPTSQFSEFESFLDRGGRLYFPMGVPQYNEFLKPYEWCAEPQRRKYSRDGLELHSVKCRAGWITAPDKPLTYDTDVWEKLEHALLALTDDESWT